MLDEPVTAQQRIGAVIVVALATALVAGGPSAARIVEHEGMHGVELGMTVAEVRARLGRPDRVVRVKAWEEKGVRYDYRRLRLKVYISRIPGARTRDVFALRTKNPRERTCDGIGVGTTEGRLRRRRPVQCYNFPDGRACLFFYGVRTEFRIARRRVAEVLIRDPTDLID